MNRCRFLLASASATAIAACSSPDALVEPVSRQFPSSAGSPFAKTLFTRMEIEEFSKHPELVAAIRTGIQKMREVVDPKNTGSYKYWHYSHWMPAGSPPSDMVSVWNQCKHADSFFMSWHRGFLHYFEKILRQASGNKNFSLPYWDYYKNPNLPKIFTEPTLQGGAPNPLYWPRRERTTVAGLTFSAFADSVTVFPWGPGETFEDLAERNPHNRVHDQVGGSMGQVPSAPQDPIFWVHHCNIDRYWSAWIAAGGGRQMPPANDDLFWKERFAYNLGGSWNVSVREMNDSKNLGYTYDNLSLPTAPQNAVLPVRPSVVAQGANNSAGAIALGLRPVTIEIPLDGLVASANSVSVVLDDVHLTALGAHGGYDFSVYANLPTVRTPIAQARSFEIGEFGSFNLSMPRMNGMTMSPGAGRTLRFTATSPGRSLFLSFVAYGGPAGAKSDAELVRIGRISVVPR
jgi:tyrosinase